jgi:hypothetical protein
MILGWIDHFCQNWEDCLLGLYKGTIYNWWLKLGVIIGFSRIVDGLPQEFLDADFAVLTAGVLLTSTIKIIISTSFGQLC